MLRWRALACVVGNAVDVERAKKKKKLGVEELVRSPLKTKSLKSPHTCSFQLDVQLAEYTEETRLTMELTEQVAWVCLICPFRIKLPVLWWTDACLRLVILFNFTQSRQAVASYEDTPRLCLELWIWLCLTVTLWCVPAEVNTELLRRLVLIFGFWRNIPENFRFRTNILGIPVWRYWCYHCCRSCVRKEVPLLPM